MVVVEGVGWWGYGGRTVDAAVYRIGLRSNIAEL